MNKNIKSDVEDKAIRQCNNGIKHKIDNKKEVVFVSTFPPKVCGIATYTQDLIKSLQSKFGNSFKAIICPMETEDENYEYEEKSDYKLNTSDVVSFLELAAQINKNDNIQVVMLQHEFGFRTIMKLLSIKLQ